MPNTTRDDGKPAASLPARTAGPLAVRLAPAARRSGAWRGVERRHPASRQALAERVRKEFDEMPGLQLTVRQAARLFGLRVDVSARVLGELERAGVLQAREPRMFRRRTALPWPRRRTRTG